MLTYARKSIQALISATKRLAYRPSRAGKVASLKRGRSLATFAHLVARIERECFSLLCQGGSSSFDFVRIYPKGRLMKKIITVLSAILMSLAFPCQGNVPPGFI
jgi:hypothetical protein